MNRHWPVVPAEGARRIICDSHWHRYVGGSQAVAEDSCPGACRCDDIVCVAVEGLLSTVFSWTAHPGYADRVST